MNKSFWAVLMVALASSACADDKGELAQAVDPATADAGDEGEDWSCLEPLPRAKDGACTPAYEPVFSAIFSQTLSKSCGFSSCHSAMGRAAGLVLDREAKEAFDALMNPNEEGWVQVAPGNPECSPLMMRLESGDAKFVMPPMGALSEGERCAITQWIADGAKAP